MEFSKKLREKGIKVTPQRRTVYAVLSRLCHASVEKIVSEVISENPDITVSTVYNVLDCLATNEIISRLSTKEGKLFYDITPGDHHHIIDNTNEIVDYNDDNLTKQITEHLKKHPIKGFDVKSFCLQIYAERA